MVKYSVLICFFCLSIAVLGQQAPADLGVIPAPNKVELKKSSFTISGTTNIVYADDASGKSAVYLANFLKTHYGLSLPVVKRSGEGPDPAIVFTPVRQEQGEAYLLSVQPAGIILSGGDAGMFYGVQTLLQMMRRGKEGVQVMCADITDKPRYKYRGIMQDVGYHFFPVEFIKSQIDMLAKYKMNVYHWHLTEDNGWRIEIRKYPKLTSVGAFRESSPISNYTDSLSGADHLRYGGYYTQKEIKEVIDFARDRHVTVIPEIELPGHSLAALASYPELACGDKPGPFKVAEQWGVFEDVYCAGKENTFRFLEDVLSEVMDLFPSPYIHIGGDECPKERWKNCKYCQKRIRDNKLKDEFELQSYFIKRIEKFINSKGRKIIGWDEIMEGGLAPNATVMSWRSIDEGVKAAQLGRDVVAAPVSQVYFDYVQGKRELEPLAIAWGYNPLERVYAYDPTPGILTEKQKQHIIGVEAPIWTEHIDTYRKVEYMLYPRLMALAEIAWTEPENKDAVGFFESRLPLHLASLDTTGKIYRVPGPIGIADTTLYGSAFTLELKPPVTGAKIFYNFEGMDARETDFLYEKPIQILLNKGEKRQMKALVVTPSGKRSINTTVYFMNPSTD